VNSLFLDLQPGWRLRTVTPIPKSGGFRLPEPSAPQGSAITVDAQGEFLGMETAFYEVGRDMRITLASVEAAIDGKTELRTKPLATLVGLPEDARHLRLVYLTRSSEADHDMAIAAGRTPGELNELTRGIQADPGSACKSTAYCAWIPAGIAVVAHAKVNVDGEEKWVAANGRLGEAAVGLSAPQILRQWKGRPVPVLGAPADVLALPIAQGDIIRSQ
jgi:hypothetical protein